MATLAFAQVIIVILLLYVVSLHVTLTRRKENEYYTDYLHNNLILRIFKTEFEYQAIGNVSREKLLDSGNFSQYYRWALIEK